MLTLSPEIGELLVKITEMPDIDMALKKVLFDYLELKMRELQNKAEKFEDKWGISFREFSKRCEQKDIGKDIYSYEVEKDFWEWERIETLKTHYKRLKS